MRRRRHPRDAWSGPSGLAEVELFAFWEADVAGNRPTDPVNNEPDHEPDPAPQHDLAARPSPAPLWCALGSVLLFLLVALAL